MKLEKTIADNLAHISNNFDKLLLVPLEQISPTESSENHPLNRSDSAEANLINLPVILQESIEL